MENTNGERANPNNGNNDPGGQEQRGRALQNPGKLDYKRAEEVFKKLVRENQEWLKEMANR